MILFNLGGQILCFVSTGHVVDGNIAAFFREFDADQLAETAAN